VRLAGSADLDRVQFDSQSGLVPVIAQHARTGEVLMFAWANRDALERTLAQGLMWYWSRSRSALWRKGDTSGNTQRVLALFHDCDADAILAHVEPTGPSCHTGEWSCFGAPPTLAALQEVIAQRAAGGDGSSYTRRLLDDENLRLKKLGEEAVELALACRDRATERARDEAADLLYHLLVACNGAGVSLDGVLEALDRRRSAPPATSSQPVEDQQDNGSEDRDPE
jgi:phosphoribosyl-ATP pyrophosphohydrolase/phosphoribosyl-AMP cyclohydrolase